MDKDLAHWAEPLPTMPAATVRPPLAPLPIPTAIAIDRPRPAPYPIRLLDQLSTIAGLAQHSPAIHRM